MIDRVVILLGTPGSGKGTLGRLLSQRFGIPLISTGELLRAAARSGDDDLKATLESGSLVSDDAVTALVDARLRGDDCVHGFILDGYPRSLAQASYLSGLSEAMGLGAPCVLHLSVTETTVLERLASRLHCSECGRTYHDAKQPPQRKGYCDDDGEPLIRRRDDDSDIVAKRFQAYATFTAPLIGYYKSRGYQRLNGEADPANLLSVASDILMRPLPAAARTRMEPVVVA